MLHALIACSGPDGVRVPTTPSTGETGAESLVELGPLLVLSEPPANGVHHHATVAWGDDRYALAFVVNSEPDTQAWVRVFDALGVPVADTAHLNLSSSPRADKPDIEWDGARWVLSWDDAEGGIWLGALSPTGLPSGRARLYDAVDLVTEAVDLAVRPDGTGIAIWTEAGGPGMGPDDGRIVWQGFDAALLPVGTAEIAEASSKKASDASPREDGSWIGVWAIHEVHPTIPGEYAYEVHAKLYPATGGEPTAFRVDDAEASWPSRPAVAVGPDAGFAVSWRDKTASEGDSAGAYGRLYAADGAPLGPSIALDPGGDGDRVVVGWAGDRAVFAWQETMPDGTHGVELSVVDAAGAVLVDRVEVSEPGGDADERPSITVRAVDGGHEVLTIWETRDGIRGRVVTIR